MSFRSIQTEFRVRHNRAVGVCLALAGVTLAACTPSAIPEQDSPPDVVGSVVVAGDILVECVEVATAAAEMARRELVNTRIDELNDLTAEITAWTHEAFELVPSTNAVVAESDSDGAAAAHLAELDGLVDRFRVLDSSANWLAVAPRAWLLATSELLDRASAWLSGQQTDTSYADFVASYNGWSSATESLARSSGAEPAATWLSRSAAYSITELDSRDWAERCTPLACCVIARTRAESARVHKEQSSMSATDPSVTAEFDRLVARAESCLVHVCSEGGPATTCER